jgi:hypothetical protein
VCQVSTISEAVTHPPALIGQDQQPINQEPKAAEKTESPCVTLKRMGPADEVTSHLYSFGIRGKQFQYVEGNFPKGFKFHGRLTDNDVRQIMDRGGKIQILEPKYTQSDLESVRKNCSEPGAAGANKETPERNEKAQGNSATATFANHPSEPSATSVSIATATISVSSSPDGADVYVDDAFVGNAPAILKVAPGKRTVKLVMAGFKDWSREITTQVGSEAHLAANLEKPNLE